MSLFVNTIKSKEARFRTSLDPFEHLRSRGYCTHLGGHNNKPFQ